MIPFHTKSNSCLTSCLCHLTRCNLINSFCKHIARNPIRARTSSKWPEWKIQSKIKHWMETSAKFTYKSCPMKWRLLISIFSVQFCTKLNKSLNCFDVAWKDIEWNSNAIRKPLMTIQTIYLPPAAARWSGVSLALS